MTTITTRQLHQHFQQGESFTFPDVHTPEKHAATLNPTTLLAMFNTPQLKAVAQEVEDTIVKIMKEVAAN